MKLIAFTIFLLFSLTSYSQITDTVFCDNGGMGDIEFVLRYRQQQCPDSCNGYYNIETLSSNTIVNSVTGPEGYSSTELSDSTLCPGEYVLVLENTVFGTYCTMVFTIESLQPFMHSIAPYSTSSPGVCDGWAELSLSGGNPPYSISWYDQNQNPMPVWETGTTLDSLCTGNYYYKVTYNLQCCDTCYAEMGTGSGNNGLVPFTINEEILLFENDHVDESCPGFCDGSVSLYAFGGTGNYIYELNGDFNFDGNFNNLCLGDYVATVTDDIGNFGIYSFTIEGTEPGTASVISGNETCEGNCDGYIDVYYQDGSFTHWSIDGGATFNTNNTFYALCPGEYVVYGLNTNVCPIYISNITIEMGTNPIINSVDATPPTSTSSYDGCINSINVTGGSSPYQYTVNAAPPQIVFPICGLGEGVHIVCASDVNGCTSCVEVELNSSSADLKQVTTDDFTFFPNPTVGTIHLDVPFDGLYVIRLLALTGNVVLEKSDLNSKQTVLSLDPTIENGTYIIEIRQGQSTLREALILNR